MIYPEQNLFIADLGWQTAAPTPSLALWETGSLSLFVIASDPALAGERGNPASAGLLRLFHSLA
jgi:hypothetical protein